MFVLVDADLLVYRCGFVAEKTFYTLTWDDPVYGPESREFRYSTEMKAYLEEHHIEDYKVEKRVVIDPLRYCLSTVKSMLKSIAIACGVSTNHLTLYLSGPSNFRDVLGTIKPYKGNRLDAPKPVYATDIKSYMEQNYHVVWSDDEEADDVLAYTHLEHRAAGQKSCIATVDKDLKMVPGLHYDFVKEEFDDISEEDADIFFWKQMIMGDSTDNIQGIKGKGAVAANEMLDGKEAFAEEIVIAAYQEAYGDEWENAINENCILLNMRRVPGEMRRIV